MSAGVAVWAHIGGFAAGVLLIKLFKNDRLLNGRGAGPRVPARGRVWSNLAQVRAAGLHDVSQILRRPAASPAG